MIKKIALVLVQILAGACGAESAMGKLTMVGAISGFFCSYVAINVMFFITLFFVWGVISWIRES